MARAERCRLAGRNNHYALAASTGQLTFADRTDAESTHSMRKFRCGSSAAAARRSDAMAESMPDDAKRLLQGFLVDPLDRREGTRRRILQPGSPQAFLGRAASSRRGCRPEPTGRILLDVTQAERSYVIRVLLLWPVGRGAPDLSLEPESESESESRALRPDVRPSQFPRGAGAACTFRPGRCWPGRIRAGRCWRGGGWLIKARRRLQARTS